jgi:hypothetical protein
MGIKYDDLSVGDHIICIKPIEREIPNFNLFSTSTITTITDTSYCSTPMRIVSIDLPFVVVEDVDGLFKNKRHLVNLNGREWKKLRPELIQQMKGGER